MKINGREITFKRTIWATFAVAALCPDNDPAKLDDVLRANFVDGNMTAASFVCLLSEGSERFKEFEAAQRGETYVMRPLTFDEIMNMEDFGVFQDLFMEAVDAWKNDAKPTVEGKAPKSKKKPVRVK